MPRSTWGKQWSHVKLSYSSSQQGHANPFWFWLKEAPIAQTLLWDFISNTLRSSKHNHGQDQPGCKSNVQMVSTPNHKSHPVTWNWAHSAQISACIWRKLDSSSLKGSQIQPVFWVCNKPSKTGKMALALGFIWTLLPESWCYLVVTTCMGTYTVPTSTSQTSPQGIVQLQVRQMSSKVHHLSQRQNSSTISVKAIHTSRTAFCKGFQIKWRASFVSSITSTQLVDNLLGKGQATVILRDSSQQQAQLWICFIFKSHSQCRSRTSWIVPFTYTVIMLKNHSNRYKRKKDPNFNLYFESSLAQAHMPNSQERATDFWIYNLCPTGGKFKNSAAKAAPKVTAHL